MTVRVLAYVRSFLKIMLWVEVGSRVLQLGDSSRDPVTTDIKNDEISGTN